MRVTRVRSSTYSDTLEAQRFGSVDASAAFHDYLLRKYAARSIDVVVAVTADAVNYMLKHVDLFPHTPIVFYGRAVSPAAAERRASEMTGVTLPGNFGKTLDTALELHPQTREVLVISGEGQEDQRLDATRGRSSRDLKSGWRSDICRGFRSTNCSIEWLRPRPGRW